MFNPAVFPTVCPYLQLKWAPQYPTIEGQSLVVRLTFPLVPVWPAYKCLIVYIYLLPLTIEPLLLYFSPPNDTAGIKPGANTAGVTGPTSQIPGLSQSAETDTPVERISGRRVGIFESDSEYVKLAKGGGHRGEAPSVN